MNKSKEIEVLVLITLVGLLLFSAVLEANAFRRVRRDSSSASASGSQQQMDMGNSSSAMNQSSEAASFSKESGIDNNNMTMVQNGTFGTSVGTKPLRIMTFNIWVSGQWVHNGLEKIANHIKLVDPDIVALQEVLDTNITEKILQFLGEGWSAVHHSSGHPDTGIVTKHQIVSQTALKSQFIDPFKLERVKNPGLKNGSANNNSTEVVENGSDSTTEAKKIHDQTPETVFGTGAAIRLNGSDQVVNFFSMHLEYRSYGPYAAHNNMVTKVEQILAGEDSAKWDIGRAHNIRELLANADFKGFMQRTDKEPLIVAGDFNCPSHLDWTEETKGLHNGWVVPWPATKMMADAGLTDSFRELHPNVTEVPGATWSTIQKSSGWEWDYSIPEPQDRIDFIMYKAESAGFKPTKSYTYAGDKPLKTESEDYQSNDYPSDHYAVITEFNLGASKSN